MTIEPITYVAMDTHKKQHSLAVLATETGETIELTISNTAKEITRMVKKIKKLSDAPIRFCYEAGVCGFALKRKLEALGCECAVIAPSLIPSKPGERIKTDRRDAQKLLSLFKAGLLTEVFAPDQEQESARELTRLRQTAQENLKRIRHQIIKMLTRHGYIYRQGRHWTNKHHVWLKSLEFTDSQLTSVFENYFTELQHCQTRLKTIDTQVELLAAKDPYREPVALLRCFHGIDTLTAISIITEIFDFGRFAPGAQLKKRRQNQPQWAINIADHAGQRLTKRYRYLVNKGKQPCKANIAIARELVGFIWSLIQEHETRNKEKAA